MDYIGSKAKLDMWILSRINKHFKREIRGKKTLFDVCSGTGIISRYATQCGYNVIANDIQSFAYHIAKGSLSMSKNRSAKAESHIKTMNRLQGINGFFYKNYSENSGRLYFTDQNARKIDACRKYIENINDDKIKSYLIYCGLEAMSRVSNTTGVQAAYLKKYKKRAKNEYMLKKEPCMYAKSAKFFNEDILELIKSDAFRKKHSEDILYFDPPYNERQYGPNYHLYETFAKYDNPDIKGVTGLRDWKNETKSIFCSKKGILDGIFNIVNNTTAKYIYISYSSDGIIRLNEIAEEFFNNVNGYMRVHKKDQRRYKSDNNRKNNSKKLDEYLIEIIRC